MATYKGTLPGSPNAYTLDDHHHFETGRPMLVCGNTAAMVGDSWLGQHFTVQVCACVFPPVIEFQEFLTVN